MITSKVFGEEKVAVLFLIIPLLYWPCYISNDILLEYTKEDGVYENIGAVLFLLTSLISLLIGFRGQTFQSKELQTQNTNRLFFIGFGCLFFFAFGEEVSWGQRIFNYETPSIIDNHNVQGEFNLHNIGIFHGKTLDGEEKKGVLALLTMHRLFYLFFLSYLLLFPLLHKLNASFRTVNSRLGIPVPPIIFGILFCYNWLYGNILRAVLFDLKGHGVVEIKETIFAVILCLFAWSWLRLKAFKKTLIHWKAVFWGF